MARDVKDRCMHLTGLCMHALPHDVTGQCMQLLYELCCFDFVSDMPLSPATLCLPQRILTPCLCPQWGSVTHQMAVPVPSISSCVLNHHNLFYPIQNTLPFNRDTCCHLALCLRLLPFHWTTCFKNVSNCLNTNIYTFLEMSGGQSSNLYLVVVPFFNTSVN